MARSRGVSMMPSLGLRRLGLTDSGMVIYRQCSMESEEEGRVGEATEGVAQCLIDRRSAVTDGMGVESRKTSEDAGEGSTERSGAAI